MKKAKKIKKSSNDTKGVKPANVKSSSNNVKQRKFSFKNHPILLLFLIALAIRLVYLATLAARPGFSMPIVDEIAYDRVARLISTGQGFGPGPLYRPPLWSAVLGLVYVLFGGLFQYARLTNVILGALAVTSIYRLGVKLFDKKTAFASGLIYSVYGLMVHYSGTGLVTSLFIYLVLEAVNLTIATTDKYHWKKIVPVGLLWGLASVARPVALLPAIIILIHKLIKSKLSREERYRSALYYLIGLGIAILPFTARNVLQGDPVLISTNGGINFYLGNNEHSTGFQAYHPILGVFWTPESAHQWAEGMTGHRMKPTEVSKFYLNEGVRYLAFNPLQGLKLFGQKILLAFNGIEISNNGDLDFMAQHNPMLKILMLIGYGLITPFALVGIFLTWKQDNSRLTAIIALTLLFINIFFFVNARFRLPSAALFIPFAAYMGERIFRAGKKLDWKPVLVPSVSVLIVGILVNANLARVPIGGNPTYGYFLLGQVLVREGKTFEAIKAFETCLEQSSSAPLANIYLGELNMQIGNPQKAVEYFNTELEMADNIRAFKGLGLAYRQLERRADAEKVFTQAVELSPNDMEIRSLLAQEIGEKGITQADAGEWKESLETFERATKIDPNNPFFVFAIASAHWVLGEHEKADSEIGEVLKVFPNFTPAVEWKNGWRPDSSGEGPTLFAPEKPVISDKF
ncbi:MAG: tetratricopeptide repeat protein [Candidatus Electryonea clarkiae]|nr:tetratricopeptide repeat protein [Candidatus Electryonea clarkiae]MDP8287782.1 tetratricopeptide repeat protein [Candidatus Electryonea clarkiae]